MLTVADAARITGRNPETIRRWIRSGRLQARKFGTQHVIDEGDLDELLNGVRAVGAPDWLRKRVADAGWDIDEIARIVRSDRDER